MSLYRQTRSSTRTVVVAASVAALVALAAGFAAGRATTSTPTVADQVDELRADVEPVAAGMELARTHYAGDRAAGLAQARRASDDFAEIEDDLSALFPDETRRARAAIDATVAAAERGAPASEVGADAERAQSALEPLAGR